MKKFTKTFSILAALAVFTGSGLFAQTKVPETKTEAQALYQGAETVAVSVKVKNKKDGQHVMLKLRNNKTYEAKAFDAEGTEALDVLAKRDGKKAVVSGYIDQASGLFKVIKIGGLTTPLFVDEK